MLQACPDALLDDGLLDITYIIGNPAESASAVVGTAAGLVTAAWPSLDGRACVPQAR